MTEYAMTINGAAVQSAAEFDVVNPATGQVFATAPACTREQLDQVMDAAQRAWLEWRTDEDARRKALLEAAEVLGSAADELAALVTAEQGKPLSEAAEEVRDAQTWFRYYADVEDQPQVIQDDAAAYVEIVRKPLGVVAAITPWNFPITLAAWKLAPALRAGNTVVLKPSPYTPVATLRLGQLLSGVFPPGVVSVVSGGDELGQWVTSHNVPRKISFTGSVRTGMRVAATAAHDLKRFTLELGGNDPAILLDDVDAASIAEKLFWAAFENNGQVCSAIKRIYAHTSIYDDVVDSLASYARSVKVGDGAVEGTRLGPINNRPQLARVRHLVDDALTRGARCATGGKPIDGPGYFYEPTILADACDGMAIVDDEQFGPALPIVRYDNLNTVIEQVNSSNFGLCGSVWSSDLDRASAVAPRIDSGTVFANTHLALQPNQPFGGSKWSGIGVENGVAGLHGFSEPQVFHRPAGNHPATDIQASMK
ncbi:aldehyde dehydrogenase family protein [Rhodococcus opacus]|uniref:aldehyde dehydrogenase family protein n=2 Tax=Rhodococcus opacus TaxID=37919 RepID=UPI001469E094|nr:aldehyde dehydrogenase family protein [Rhodococcus opacus]MDJ0415368.1 aldehyde dehydrogenase family protein [Rhodococcus opacus]MDV7090943.1 aldehyde dehydrogenase family protein [Rhodococcus opacus]